MDEHFKQGAVDTNSSTVSTAAESAVSLRTQPFPASRKVYVEGKFPGVRVPMREISLTPTRSANGGPPTPNPPITVYDTSGPYTDPSVTIDLRAGLPPLRRRWILDRGDVEELDDVSSVYGRQRASDPKLQHLRFPRVRKPLRAKPGKNVTQLHYARKGIITPEMEFVAIRENQSRELAKELASRNSHSGMRQHPG
ncbi:MAG: phosphomethylpyrimidine synthase ThiC, partial [Nitrospira sp.]